MKTLVNKNNPAIRITAPEITLENHCYYIWTDDGDCIIEFWEKDWTLIEEEPVDFEKLSMEKYPETMTYDSRGLYDRKKYDRDIYKQGLKDGYNLKHKIRNDNNNL